MAAPASAAHTLTTLAAALDALGATRVPHEIQQIVHIVARRLTGADGATFALRDRDEVRYVDENAIDRLWKGRRVPLDVSPEGWAIRHRTPLVIDDVYADERVPHEAYGQTFVMSLLVMPVGGDEPVGAIGLYWADQHHPGEEEIAVVRALASGAAVALERARLAQEVERRRVNEEDLRKLSERDPLTGVLNRRAWDQLLASAIRKGTTPLYVALLDLDHFKAYNDRYGHPAGDELLRRAARAWRAAIRAGDVLARYGGEEFAVLLTGCEGDVAMHIAERLRNATTGGQHVSIGMARWDGRETAVELVDRADRALYEAKRAGRNRVVMA